jgi:hypothetical protein
VVESVTVVADADFDNEEEAIAVDEEIKIDNVEDDEIGINGNEFGGAIEDAIIDDKINEDVLIELTGQTKLGIIAFETVRTVVVVS